MPKHETIDDYISGCTEEVAHLMQDLRVFINETLTGDTEGMLYGAPVFFNANKAAVIYLYAANKHVNFGFLKYAELIDPQGILQGSGKPSKHVKVFPGQSINKAMLRGFIKQCEALEL